MQFKQLKGKTLTYAASGYNWIEFRLNDRATVRLEANYIVNSNDIYQLSRAGWSQFYVDEIIQRGNNVCRLSLLRHPLRYRKLKVPCGIPLILFGRGSQAPITATYKVHRKVAL